MSILQKLEVGSPFPGYSPSVNGERVSFESDSSGFFTVIGFSNPSAKEIEQFSANKRFEIHLTKRNGILFLIMKFGSLNYIDASYNPHIVPNTDIFKEDIPDGEGYGLNVFFVDNLTGIIKSQRLIGLGTRFSRIFRQAVLDDLSLPFDQSRYNFSLNQIYQKYSSSQLAKLSTVYYKI